MSSLVSSWTQVLLLFVVGFLCISAKPVQNENAETVQTRRLDPLSGLTIGSSKSTRSIGDYPRSLDSLGGGNLLRSLDTICQNNLLRSLDSLGGGHLLRSLDSMDEGSLLRTLDSLGGGNLLRRQPSGAEPLGAGSGPVRSESGSGAPRSTKRLNTLSGLSLGLQKRTFDEVDRTAFDGFSKRNFDEVDRVGFDGFTKRNVRSAPASS